MEMPTASAGEVVTNIAPKTKKDGETPVLVPAVDAAACLWAPHKVDVGVSRDVSVELHPISAIADGKCIEFNLPQTNLFYFDARKSVLKLKVRILTADNVAVKNTDHVGLVQNPLNSMWRNCDLLLQQQAMSTAIGYNIAYKAVMDQLVYTPEEHLNTGAQTSGFYYDTPGSLDSVDFSQTGVNKGLLERFEFTKDGEEMWLQGPLAHDFFTLPTYLPSGLQLILRLYPHSNDFVLLNGMLSDTYKVQITECVLIMRGVELTSSTLAAHNKILAESDAIFHYHRSQLRAYSIPSSISNWSMNQIFVDEIPFDLVVGIVDSDNYLGNEKNNPYNFGTHNLNFISLTAEGYQSQSFHVNFKQHQYASAYAALYEGDVGTLTRGGVIKYKDFPRGYALYRFRLCPVSNERVSRLRRGVTRLTINFSAPTTKTLTAIIYGRFHDYFTMDLARNIQLTHCGQL